jgi:lipoic acid synthetase
LPVSAARLPVWARKGSPIAPGARGVRLLLREGSLNTVCEEARCPNLGECFSRGTATFMLLGDHCTRRCDYCAVATGRPLGPDPQEPARVAAAAARMRLRYVVLTSVNRDDLADGGASHFAATVRSVRERLPGARVEVLTPDFKGERAALRTVLDARPEVFNHNIETVPRLFRRLRPQGRYELSLDVLVGLGETDGEVHEVLRDLRSRAVDIVTIGQYLRPSREHAPVARYLPPSAFAELEARAREMGFATVHSGVFVRSSFNAEEVYREGAAR